MNLIEIIGTSIIIGAIFGVALISLLVAIYKSLEH
jgi:hypothetical protein